MQVCPMLPQSVEDTGHPKAPVGFCESPLLVPGWILFIRVINGSTAVPECPAGSFTI